MPSTPFLQEHYWIINLLTSFFLSAAFKLFGCWWFEGTPGSTSPTSCNTSTIVICMISPFVPLSLSLNSMPSHIHTIAHFSFSVLVLNHFRVALPWHAACCVMRAEWLRFDANWCEMQSWLFVVLLRIGLIAHCSHGPSTIFYFAAYMMEQYKWNQKRYFGMIHKSQVPAILVNG